MIRPPEQFDCRCSLHIPYYPMCQQFSLLRTSSAQNVCVKMKMSNMNCGATLMVITKFVAQATLRSMMQQPSIKWMNTITTDGANFGIHTIQSEYTQTSPLPKTEVIWGLFNISLNMFICHALFVQFACVSLSLPRLARMPPNRSRRLPSLQLPLLSYY